MPRPTRSPSSTASTAYYTNDDDEKKETFLLVQHVPSVQLDSIWPSLSLFEKDDVFAQLQLVFDATRRVGCPWPKFFGGLDGGSFHHYLFSSQHGDRRLPGRFIGESAFVAGLTGNYRALVDCNNNPNYKVLFFEKSSLLS